MLTARRAFALNLESSPPLPQVPELRPLYKWGIIPRRGQLIMVAGRSGSQKSGFVLFWTARMGLPTLYCSGDMSPFEATSRLVSLQTGESSDVIEAKMLGGDKERYLRSLDDVNVQFSFGQPIRFSGIEAELDAYVEVHNAYPEVIVVDNLMDIEGCESEYVAQQAAMQDLAGLSRDTGSTVIVTHHATDKSREAENHPGLPAARREIKNGLSEKPQLTLSVALAPGLDRAGKIVYDFRVACVKQRSGRSDPTAMDYVSLRAFPELTRFGPQPWEVGM